MSQHLVLLGDSSFDNGTYTRGEPDVASHLRARLGESWTVSLLAVDGSTTADVDRQLGRVPSDASHLVLSVGGNDVLRHWGVLKLPASTNTDALMDWAAPADRFEQAYRALVARLIDTAKPVVACTIYNGNLDSPRAEAARLALRLFNDAILRIAFEHALSVIDLRLVCAHPDDYATPIEPSGEGGRKIAAAIGAATDATASARRPARVFV